MRNQRAFTLLEMLVILAVLGAVASMTLPDLTPVIRRTEMRGSTGDAVAIVERARRDSRSGGRCVRVRLDAGALVLERAAGARCEEGTFTVQHRVRPGTSVTFGLASSSDSAITFAPNGRLFGNGDSNIEDEGARIHIRSAAFPNQHAFVGVTSAGLVCSRLSGVVPDFEPSRVCVQQGTFFGGTDTEDGEVELGDGDALPAGVGGPETVVNVPEPFVPGAPPAEDPVDPETEDPAPPDPVADPLPEDPMPINPDGVAPPAGDDGTEPTADPATDPATDPPPGEPTPILDNTLPPEDRGGEGVIVPDGEGSGTEA